MFGLFIIKEDFDSNKTIFNQMVSNYLNVYRLNSAYNRFSANVNIAGSFQVTSSD